MYDDEDDYDFDPTSAQARLTPRERSESFIRTTVLVESGLAFVAVGLGWLLDVPPWISASWQSESVWAVLRAIGLGTVATIPLLAVFLWLQYSRIESLNDLQELIQKQIVPLFSKATFLELGLISLAAGLGEEALFRGVIQTYLQKLMGVDGGPAIPILLASLLFGLVHFVSREYLLLSTLMGLYLGLWFWWTEDLIVPIVIHTLYDWFALVYLQRTVPVSESEPDEK